MEAEAQIPSNGHIAADAKDEFDSN